MSLSIKPSDGWCKEATEKTCIWCGSVWLSALWVFVREGASTTPLQQWDLGNHSQGGEVGIQLASDPPVGSHPKKAGWLIPMCGLVQTAGVTERPTCRSRLQSEPNEKDRHRSWASALLIRNRRSQSPKLRLQQGLGVCSRGRQRQELWNVEVNSVRQTRRRNGGEKSDTAGKTKRLWTILPSLLSFTSAGQREQ